MEESTRISAAVREHFDRQVAFLQRMVCTRSTNPFTPDLSPPDAPVEEGVAALILDELQRLGLQAFPYGVSAQRPNIVCRLPGTDTTGKMLILNTHMDTVEPSRGYTRDPFGGQIEQGRLYGVGAADAKAQIAAFIYAVHALREIGVSLKGCLTLAFVVDEESGACSPFGTQYLLEQGLLHGNAALVGEPGNCKIAIGHRGVYRFRAQTYGEAVHTGLREWEEGTRGRNAILEMARLAIALSRCPLPHVPSPAFPITRA